MILLPGAVKIFVATYPVSLRKSFDGLMNEVRSVLGKNPLCGHVFVFLNRRKTMVKLLVWTRGGFMILHKRLERGKFSFRDQVHNGAVSVQIEEHELSMLLEGLEAQTTRQSKRWNPPSPSRNRHAEAEIVH
jgi:transposase